MNHIEEKNGYEVNWPIRFTSERTMRFQKILTSEGEWVGFIWIHPDKRDETRECRGTVMFNGPGLWSKTGDEADLTIAPSILCVLTSHAGCGRHGFIEKGAWREC